METLSNIWFWRFMDVTALLTLAHFIGWTAVVIYFVGNIIGFVQGYAKS